MKINVRIFLLILIAKPVFAMTDYSIEKNLTLEQSNQASNGLKAINGFKRARPKIHESAQSWAEDIVEKKISPTKLRSGETIFTYIIGEYGTRDFGDVHFDVLRVINAMTQARANINQENAKGQTPLTIAIRNNRKILIGGMVQNGAVLDRWTADGTPNNTIRAGLAALKTAALNYLPSKYARIYQRQDCQMLMAYLIDNVDTSTITKSQVHAAWNLGYKDVSWALAMVRKHPQKRTEIVMEFKKRICARLVREFKKVE